MPVTSADVARVAGVSRATVSYVLNETPGHRLTTGTRETVLRVARELGYQPNALARSLKRGRSDTVLLPMAGVPMNPVLQALSAACTAALAPFGFSLVLDLSRHHDPDAQAETWARLAPAAVLDLVLHHSDPALARLRARGIPVLSTSATGEDSWESAGDSFAREQRLAQLRHLAARGHRRIRAVLPRSFPGVVDPRTERRLLAEATEQAAESRVELTVDRVELDEVAATVAGWAELPDAVAAHNDTFAVAVVTALARCGVRVPDQVAVIGADDEPLAAAVTPALTTVAGDFAEFAAAVAEAVAALVTGGGTSGPLPVPGVVLVERASA